MTDPERQRLAIPSYAKRLSSNPNKGVVGLAEMIDSERTKQRKLAKLVKFIRESKRIVCLTGAGISTSAGIADFRGPNGVWTKEKANEQGKKSRKRGKASQSFMEDQVEEEDDASFESAKPTRTHEILTLMQSNGMLEFLVSQNVDGLHLRSGFPRHALSELHGNIFMERCAECRNEVLHDRDLGGVGCKPTGSKCEICKGLMHDTVLDWDTPICDVEMNKAEGNIAKADLVLCLGTSLRIIPAAELPLLVGTERVDDIEPRICIVNLQKTPLDSKADLVLHSKVDEVMEILWEQLKDFTPQISSMSETQRSSKRPRRQVKPK